MDITGKIIGICDLQKGTSKAGNEWKSQTFILETDGDRPRKVAFELFGSKHDDFSAKCTMGAALTVHFDVESREFNGRWYTSIRAWKITDPSAAAPEKQESKPAAAPAAEVSEAQQAPAAPAPQAEDNGTELPF